MKKLILLLCCPLLVWASDATDRQAQIDALAAEIATLSQAIAQDVDEQAQLTQALRELDLDIAALALKQAETEHDLNVSQATLSTLQDQYAHDLQQLSLQQATINEQSRSAYLMGRHEQLKMLLNQSDPQTIGRLLTYFQYFNQARSDILTDLQQQLAQLQTTQTAVIDEEARLQSLQQQQAHTYETLASQKQVRQTKAAALVDTISAKNTTLQTLQADKLALEGVVSDLQAQTPVTRFSGDIDEPLSVHQGQLAWPVMGQVQHQFGEAYVDSDMRWQGLLIAAPEGAPVAAIYPGEVIYADWLRGYGLLLIVDHGQDYLSLYAHNQSLYKAVGDWVTVNEPIAQVGQSGSSAQSGLYFEIRHESQVQDPSTWLVPLT